MTLPGHLVHGLRVLLRRRRTTAALPAVLVLALAVAACGGTPGAGDARSTSEGSQTSEASDPVQVEHRFGTTEVPAEPTRVVTVGFNEQDFALALGVTPVGVREYLGYDATQRPWATDLLPEEPLPLLGAAEIDVEAVAALEPDLILGVYSFMDAETYGLLSRIAPTVAESADFPEGGTPWQEQTRLTGQALGVPEEAEALVTEVEGEFAEAAAANPSFAGTVMPVDLVLDGSHTILPSSDLRSRFFTDLGFVTPEQTGEVSGELVDALDGEALVTIGGSREELVSDPLFAGLPVVQEDRTAFLGTYEQDFAAALGFSSPLSLSFALDVAVPRLAQAADGDPGTVVEPYQD